jgi:DNA-binding CsgD family transcriptional regulator
VSAYYVSSAFFGLAVFSIWKRFGVSPLKSGTVLIAISGMGFIAAMVSQFLPGISIVAPLLLGAGMTCLVLNPYFVSLITRRYPSKYIVPVYIGVAFVTVLIHSALLDALRDNLIALFIAYLVITVVLLIVYLMLEPYLLYASRGRSIQEIVDAHNEAVADGAPIEEADEVSIETFSEGVSGESEVRRKLRLAAITPLTPREYEVAEMTILGIKQSVIADTLNISPGTVNNHRSHVYDKFGVGNREALLARLEKLSRTLPDKQMESDGFE